VAEQPVPLVSPVSDVRLLGALVASRNAARVALGRVHLGPAPVELSLVGLGALSRTALHLFAVRRHRSSWESKLGFSDAYHLTTE
jgi:hypothetical protein